MCYGGRNYKKENDTYHSRPEQKANRASRNKARDLMIKAGLVSKGDGMEVDHLDRNPLNNSLSNLSIKTAKENKQRTK